MKACLVLLVVLGCAFSQTLLDKNVLNALGTAGKQLGSEIKAAATQVYQGVSKGQSINLQPVQANIANTFAQLGQKLADDSTLMAQVNNFTAQMTPVYTPALNQDKALVAGLETVAAVFANKTQNDAIKTDVEQFKNQLVAAMLANSSDLLTNLTQFYTTVSASIESLGSNIAAGTESKADLESFVGALKANVSAFVGSSAVHVSEGELKAAITQVFANNVALFSAVQNYMNQISAQLTQVAAALAKQNDTDAVQIVTALQQIANAYSTSYGTIAASNATDIFPVIKSASEQAYATVYTASMQIFTVIETQIVMIFKGFEQTNLVAQVESLAAEITQQLKQTFAQDAAFLNGLKNLKAIPNGQLVAGLNQVQNQIKGAYNGANTATLGKSVSQLAQQLVADLKPFAAQIVERNETAIKAAAGVAKSDLSAYVANNTDLKSVFEQVKTSVSAAFGNNSALYAGLQNYTSQVANDLSQLAANLSQANNANASVLASSLAQAVTGFSTGFSNVASGNGTVAGELTKAYENAATSTGKVFGDHFKQEFGTVASDAEDDVTGDNQNNNGNTPDNTPLSAGKLMMSFVMGFGALVAFFL